MKVSRERFLLRTLAIAVARKLLAVALVGVCVTSGACSVVFLDRPKATAPGTPIDCTTGRTLPVLDLVAASLMAGQLSSPPKRSAGDTAAVLAVAASLAASGVWGLRTTGTCLAQVEGARLEKQQRLFHAAAEAIGPAPGRDPWLGRGTSPQGTNAPAGPAAADAPIDPWLVAGAPPEGAGQRPSPPRPGSPDAGADNEEVHP
jgi:hypothetical protein